MAKQGGTRKSSSDRYVSPISTNLTADFLNEADRLTANQIRYTGWTYHDKDTGFAWQIKPQAECFLSDGATATTQNGTWGTLTAHWIRVAVQRLVPLSIREGVVSGTYDDDNILVSGLSAILLAKCQRWDRFRSGKYWYEFDFVDTGVNAGQLAWQKSYVGAILTTSEPPATVAESDAPQWVKGSDYKTGSLIYDTGKTFRAAKDVVNSQIAPGGDPDNFEPIYDDAAVLDLLRLTNSADPATPQSLVPTASWGLQQVGTVFSLLRDATQIPLPAGTRNTLLNPGTGEAFTPTSAVNATTSPFMGVKDGGSLTFNKPVAQVCFYDKDLRFVSSAGTISASIVAPATAYYVRLVALTEDGLDTGRTGVSSVYSTVTYSLDELPYVTGIQLPGGNIVRPNAMGVVDGSQLGAGSPGGTARDPYDVDTTKRIAVVDANVPFLREMDEAYFGKTFLNRTYKPTKQAKYECVADAPLEELDPDTGQPNPTTWWWIRIPIV